MRDRTFGVEIEHGNTRGYQEVDSLMRERFPRIFDRSAYSYVANTGCDGSGVEFRTPVLKGTAGFRTLRTIFDYLNEFGGYVGEYDGMHVHFGAEDFVAHPELVKVLVKNWVANESLIEAFVHPRRIGRGSCPRRSAYVGNLDAATTLDEIKSACNSRNALNLSNLHRNGGTIEVRLHEGTLDADVAESWIRFMLRFLAASAQGKLIRSCNTHSELFGAVPTHHVTRKQLLKRVPELVAA